MPEFGAVRRVVKLPGAVIGVSSAAEAQFKDSAGAVAYITAPGSNTLNRRRFKVRANGRVTGGTTTNFTVALYLGAAFGSGTKIATSTARACNSESANWMIEVDVVADDTSDKIQGLQMAMVNNLVDTFAALTAEGGSVDVDVEGNLAFCVTGQFSASHADNKAYLDALEVSPL